MPNAGFLGRADQPLVQTLVAIGQAVRVESQQVQDRGLQIEDGHFILGDVIAEVVRLAKHDSRLNAAAGHPDRKTVRMVVAAQKLGAGPLFVHGRAAELSAPHDQGLVEQARAA